MARADALNRLPLHTSHSEVPRPAEVVHLVELLDAPLASTQMKLWTDRDPTLSEILRHVSKTAMSANHQGRHL